jgi:hypothetical protein
MLNVHCSTCNANFTQKSQIHEVIMYFFNTFLTSRSPYYYCMDFYRFPAQLAEALRYKPKGRGFDSR